MSTDAKVIEKLLGRIERLERAVFGSGKKHAKKQNTEAIFKGPSGGIQLLLSKGFFKQPRTAATVKDEITKHGYFYRRQVVQTALNRLTNRDGPLAGFKKDGKKVYVVRK